MDKDINITAEACDIIRKNFDRFENEMREICGITDSNDEWLDTKQLCNRLNISIRTLNYFRMRMIVPYTRFGNKCYYKVSEVVRILENKRISK